MAPSQRKRSKAAAAAAAQRQWKVGDLVLAKVKGFQAWPAMVSEPEKWGYVADWKKVLVCFFGTQQIAFCNPVDVEAFTEEKKQSLLRKRHGKYSDFGRALSEIIDTFEKLKKENEVNNSSDTDEDPVVSENNTAEVLTESVSSVKSPLIASQSCHGKTVSSGIQIDVSVKSGCDADDASSNEGLSEREVPSKDVGSGIKVAERSFITTYSTRRRSERAQASRSSVLRQPPAFHSRSSSRVDTVELQNEEEPSCNYDKGIMDVPSGFLQDRSARRSKRKRRMPCIDDNEVDSPGVLSNCSSAEGNDSGILTVDSDALCCKEGSDVEWDSKSVQPVSVRDLDQPDNEFSQRLDFQENTIIHKKKRKPKRKRPSNENTEYAYEVDEKKVSDTGGVRNETIFPSDHERSPERCSREDGDAHLPLFKRARVRLSQALSTGEEPNSSQGSEEKLQEESLSLSDQVPWSLHGEVDGSTDKEALHDIRDLDKSSPQHKEPENPSVQEVKTTVECGSSLDVEAALPPSKRLHRALEVMSANAAQDDKISVAGSPIKMAGSDVNCASFSGDFCKLTERQTSSALQLGEDEELCNNKSPDGPFESPSGPDIPIIAARVSSAEATERKTSSAFHLGKDDELCKNKSPDGPFESPPSRPDIPIAAARISSAEATERKTSSALHLGKDDELCKNKSPDGPFESPPSRPDIPIAAFRISSAEAAERKTSSALQLENDEELCKDKSPDGPFESPSRPDITKAAARISSAEETNQIIGDSPGHESPKDGDHSLNSSFTEIKDAADVECSKSRSPNFFEQVSNIKCGSGPLCVAMSCDDECKTMTTTLVEPFAKADPERCQVAFDVISGTNVRVQSPYNGTSVLLDTTYDNCRTSKSCDMAVENCNDPRELKCEDNVVEIEPTERRSEPSSSPALQIELNGENQSHSGYIDVLLARPISLSENHSLEKAVSVSQSSSSLTDGLDSHATPHTLAGITSASDNAHTLCFAVVKGATNWNCKEAHVNLSSFEAILGTLTRTKESIGRATRLAIDCAKYGVASRVVEVIARNLERESSLHRRIDLFFLVDSIAQFSNGLKGDIAGIYPSAILAVLPRLLSAAAPPGSSSQENRRQCLKVLRVWLERRILPESTIRHHIRELDFFSSSSCSRASRRSFRNERAFDDPVREMEGMLVDEYGSNSSFQLPGFCMPPMLRDEDDGVDSDGESFEAVTPEHNAEKPEVEKVPPPAMEKHTHILEDIDGELEMEDVAPTESVASGCNVIGMNGVVASNVPVGNSVSAIGPPLPEDLRPASPPLPSSPPPPPPLPPLPLSSGRTDSVTKSFNTCSQVPNQISEPANCSSFRNRYVPLPQTRAINKNAQAEGFDKGFRLPPPHPAPSNQFSYVQNQRVKSRRDIPPSSNSNGSHMPNTGNGNVYRDHERIMKFVPRGFQERWRAPQHFPGPNYPDGLRSAYPPAPFAAQHCDPSLPKHRWGFPSGPVGHQGFMRHRPSSAGASFWRPR